MKCNGCDNYEKRIHFIILGKRSTTASQVLAQRRGHVSPYPSEWVFKYCPWCGTALEKEAEE